MTVLELLVAVCIATVALAVGVPALRTWGEELRVRTATTALQSDLQYARAEAIRRNVNTVVCPGRTEPGCLDSPPWNSGWIAFGDFNADLDRQATEPLLRSASATERVRITSPDSRRRLRFLPSGTAPGSNVTIRFCGDRGMAREHQIRISNSGRIRRLEPDPGSSTGC